MNKLKVLIFGGTHGNEWTGVYAVNKFSQAICAEFKDLDISFILANPEAHKINRRFKDEDLNRAFQFLHEDRPESYENQRAQEIKAMITSGPCFVIDLHTTTSSMGSTVIITHDQPLNFYIAARLSEQISDCRVILSRDPNRKYLGSQSDFGLMIEVGPVANGIIDADMLERSLTIIRKVLESVSTLENLTTGALEIYEEITDIYYPQDENGDLTSYIHKNFQGKDFVAVNGDYFPFTSFEGEEIKMKTSEELYPIFINEAAYYPSKLAFTLCRKRMINF
jgi:succinylglutamate desuccinylase